MTFPLRAGKSGRKAARRTFLFPPAAFCGCARDRFFAMPLSGIAPFRLGSAALFTKISLALLPAIFRESVVLLFYIL